MTTSWNMATLYHFLDAPCHPAAWQYSNSQYESPCPQMAQIFADFCFEYALSAKSADESNPY